MMLLTIFLSAFLTAVSPVPAVSTGDALNQQLEIQAENQELLTEISEKVDLLAAAVEPTISSTQVSEYYVNYFRGVLQNMPRTEYMAYALPVYHSSALRNITHYYLYYDLEVVDGQVVDGIYPYIDIYYYDSVYNVTYSDGEFPGYPNLGYASFSPYSALVDDSFPVMQVCVVVAGVAILFVVCRKTVFS